MNSRKSNVDALSKYETELQKKVKKLREDNFTQTLV